VLDIIGSIPKGKIKPNIDDRSRQLFVNKYKHLNLVENDKTSFSTIIAHYRCIHMNKVLYLPSNDTITIF